MSTIGLVTAVALASTAQVDKSAAELYRQILVARVKDGRVDYRAIESQDRKKLDAYLDAVAKAKMPEERNAKIGFLADAYNALVIQSVIAHGRPRSVLDVKGFFNEETHPVAGQQVTLDALEKKILNPFAQDPRTHFILVCGAVGCPILEPLPFAGSDVSARMDAATERYLSSPTGAQVTDGAMKLSMIFEVVPGGLRGAPGRGGLRTQTPPGEPHQEPGRQSEGRAPRLQLDPQPAVTDCTPPGGPTP